MIAYRKYNTKRARRTSISKKKPKKKTVGRGRTGRTIDSKKNIVARKLAYSKRAGKDLFGLFGDSGGATWTQKKGDAIFDNLDADDISEPTWADEDVSVEDILKYYAHLLNVEYGDWGEWYDDPPANTWAQHIAWVKKHAPAKYEREMAFHAQAQKIVQARMGDWANQFGQDIQYGHVVNGQRNTIERRVVNKYWDRRAKLLWKQLVSYYRQGVVR